MYLAQRASITHACLLHALRSAGPNHRQACLLSMQAECASLRGLLHDMQRQLQETQAQLVEAQLAAGERSGLQQQLFGVQEQLQEAQSGLEERDALQLRLSGVQAQLQAAESAVEEGDGLQQQLAHVQAQLQNSHSQLAGGQSNESLQQELALSDANTAGLAMERSQLQHEVGPACTTLS